MEFTHLTANNIQYTFTLSDTMIIIHAYDTVTSIEYTNKFTADAIETLGPRKVRDCLVDALSGLHKDFLMGTVTKIEGALALEVSADTYLGVFTIKLQLQKHEPFITIGIYDEGLYDFTNNVMLFYQNAVGKFFGNVGIRKIRINLSAVDKMPQWAYNLFARAECTSVAAENYPWDNLIPLRTLAGLTYVSLVLHKPIDISDILNQCNVQRWKFKNIADGAATLAITDLDPTIFLTYTVTVSADGHTLAFIKH